MTSTGSTTASGIDFDTWRRRIREETFGLYHYEMGVAIRREGNGAAAVEAFRRALDIMPTLSEAHAELIRTLDEAGRTADAEAARTQARALVPDYEARAAFRRAKDHQARNELAEALGALDTVESLAPTLPEVRLRRGQVLLLMGRLDEAAAVLLNHWPDHTSLVSETGTALRRIAEGLRNAGAVERAVPVYEWLRVIAPDDAADLAGFGLAMVMLGRVGRGSALGREAVRLDPDLVAGHLVLGIALQSAGEAEAALGCFARANRLAPGDLRVPLHAGLALQSLGRIDEAMERYQTALALAPTVAVSVSCYGLGLQGRGLFREAEARHREAIALDPTSAWAYTDLGLALEAQGRHAEALDAHRQAVAFQPQWIAYHARQRGWAMATLAAVYRTMGVPLPPADRSA